MTGHRPRQPPEEPVGHTHRLPSWLIGSILIIGVGLLAGIGLVAAQSIATNNRLTAVEQYVAGKGEQRDRENTALNGRVDRAVCQVLDQFPAGGNLDAVRGQYGCGPGLPSTTPTVATSAPTPTAAPSSSPTDPSAPRSAPPAPTTSAAPSRTRAGSSSPPPASTAPASTTQARPTPASAPTVAAPAPTRAPVAMPSTAAPTAASRGPITSLLCGLLPVCTPT